MRTALLAGLTVAAILTTPASMATADAADQIPAGPYTASVLNDSALNPTVMGSQVGQPVADVSMVLLPDGTIRAFVFVQARGLEVADSTDGGKTFTRVGSVFGSDNGYGFPRVVKTGDGRLRLYSSTSGGIACLVSSSLTSYTFTLEDADCIPSAPYGTAITGPGIVKLANGTYRAFFSDFVLAGGGPKAHSIYSASSPDGLTWTADPGVRYGPGSAITRSGEHPAAVLHPDGSIGLFAYDAGVGPGGVPSGPMGLYYARSTDGGLTFDEPTAISLTNAVGQGFGNDADVILRADGSVLLSAGGFAPSVGGYVGTYVLASSSTESPTISVTCKAKGTVGARTVVCSGSSTGIDPGSMLMPYVRYSPNVKWVMASGTHPTVSTKGTFTWTLKPTKKKSKVYVYFAHGTTKSMPVAVGL